MSRDYSVGSVLIRSEGRVDRFLRVERIDSGSITVRHEDGHRERLTPRLDIPIRQALFGYRVASPIESRVWDAMML